MENQCVALLKDVYGRETLIVPHGLRGTDPVSFRRSLRHTSAGAVGNVSKQTWRCFSERGCDPGNFIPIFLLHKIAFSSASSCVFLIWVGDALIVPEGPFQAKWNVYFNVCTCSAWLIFGIRTARVAAGASCTSGASFCFLVFPLNSELAVIIFISIWQRTLCFPARLLDINQLHILIRQSSSAWMTVAFCMSLVQPKASPLSSLMHRCNLKECLIAEMFRSSAPGLKMFHLPLYWAHLDEQLLMKAKILTSFSVSKPF